MNLNFIPVKTRIVHPPRDDISDIIDSLEVKDGDFHVNLTVTCRKIRDYLMRKHNLKNLGVVATDSHTTPLRWGVTGMAIGLAGVEPLKDIRGEPDLYQALIKVIPKVK